MIDIVELLKAVFYGIVEGITEWLPVSSTGHLILLEELMPLDVSEEFWSMFEVVIQLGAILAVIVLYFHRLNPFSPTKSVKEKQGTWDLWGKVIVAVLPAGVLGLLLDNWLDEHLYNYVTVAVTLILYGVAFLLVERSPRRPVIRTTGQITWSTALIIGLFQCLAMIPGTSRSGATILGAMLLGLSRPVAAEFSFFLAIPTMLAASLLKIVKFLAGGNSMTANEGMILVVGFVVACLVSLAVIRSLMRYVQKHSFAVFGLYRIVLGAVVLLYFLLR
ncbi:MAG TPA: undecaprenyl-diphosphate phosphatase [Candidatus Faecousia faecigallinarum]|nr:undecaprenyl-diphosphate phosphatase [Candidatus Faecousia faecigallinarum]